MREDGKEEEGFSPRALVYKWRLTGVACVVSEFRVTQPPLLSCFLELSLTLGITAHPEETGTVISQEGRDTCLRTSAPSAQRHPHSDTHRTLEPRQTALV